MTPGRVRLLSLAAIAIPVALTASAAPASPGFPALALATAAAGAALLLAGPVFRVLLAVLIAALGGVVVLVSRYTEATEDVAVWLTVALVAGILQALVGLGVVLTRKHWPASTSRYSLTRATGREAVDDWDALSAGDDPTDEPR